MFFDRGAEAAPRVTEAVLLTTLVLTASALATFRIRSVSTEVDARLAGTFLWFSSLSSHYGSSGRSSSSSVPRSGTRASGAPTSDIRSWASSSPV